METFSDWFAKSIKPKHVGAYEVRRPPNGRQVVRWFSWWDGKKWGFTAQTPAGAELCKHKVSREALRIGGFEWRGKTRRAK
jgi:hypothetical protein